MTDSLSGPTTTGTIRHTINCKAAKPGPWVVLQRMSHEAKRRLQPQKREGTLDFVRMNLLFWPPPTHSAAAAAAASAADNKHHHHRPKPRGGGGGGVARQLLLHTLPRQRVRRPLLMLIGAGICIALITYYQRQVSEIQGLNRHDSAASAAATNNNSTSSSSNKNNNNEDLVDPAALEDRRIQVHPKVQREVDSKTKTAPSPTIAPTTTAKVRSTIPKQVNNSAKKAQSQNEQKLGRGKTETTRTGNRPIRLGNSERSEASTSLRTQATKKRPQEIKALDSKASQPTSSMTSPMTTTPSRPSKVMDMMSAPRMKNPNIVAPALTTTAGVSPQSKPQPSATSSLTVASSKSVKALVPPQMVTIRRMMQPENNKMSKQKGGNSASSNIIPASTLAQQGASVAGDISMSFSSSNIAQAATNASEQMMIPQQMMWPSRKRSGATTVVKGQQVMSDVDSKVTSSRGKTFAPPDLELEPSLKPTGASIHEPVISSLLVPELRHSDEGATVAVAIGTAPTAANNNEKKNLEKATTESSGWSERRAGGDVVSTNSTEVGQMAGNHSSQLDSTTADRSSISDPLKSDATTNEVIKGEAPEGPLVKDVTDSNGEIAAKQGVENASSKVTDAELMKRFFELSNPAPKADSSKTNTSPAGDARPGSSEEPPSTSAETAMAPLKPAVAKGATTVNCGCPRTCSGGALQKKKNGITCIGRINYFMSKYKLSEADACSAAAGDNEPCGLECHPTECDTVVANIPATVVYAEDIKVADMGLSSIRSPEIDCGCSQTCDAAALQKMNKAFTCIGRIQFLMSKYKLNETAACVASTGDKEPCGMECHPTHCRNKTALQPTPLDWTKVAKTEPPPQAFVRYDKVVVATKVLWPNDMPKLKQMLCLFTAAYNRHVNYDIVVFSTVPWTRRQVQELQAVVPDAKVVVVRDSPPLQDQLAAMSPEEISFLYKRCKVKTGENITWFHHCSEPGYGVAANLGYSWQAEFRAFHIWKAKVLAEYKYMIWLDGDSFCTKPWPKDPMRMMVENDLILMADNFPQGSAVLPTLREKMQRVYKRSICAVTLSDEGRLSAKECKSKVAMPRIGLVHGFMHITNLDFYRNATNLRFLELLVGDHRFSRQADDQLAVTAPVALVAPERAWDMRRNGLNLGIHHNGQLDGKEKNTVQGYNVFWEKEGKKKWAVARDMCDNLVVYRD